MNPELEKRIIRIVNRMVLQDLSRDGVFEKLTVNRMTGEAALAIYQGARRARIKPIRIKLAKKVLNNFPYLLAVSGFTIMQFGFLGHEVEGLGT